MACSAWETVTPGCLSPPFESGIRYLGCFFSAICPNIDIRNNIKNLQKLENCTVIEGYLRISLIEHVDSEAYAKYTFPLLREITDYVLLYRVYGLTTLRDMFPNLAVIRGRLLFTNFALVAFEMIDLEDLGLISLQNISRGGVRLAKNKKLCFINTVDWARLGVKPEEQDFKLNREESQCVDLCPKSCTKTKVDGVLSRRCWTSTHCQKNLDCKCGENKACMDDGQCCHEYCLGGCTGSDAHECFVCRDVVYQNNCHLQCPHPTYMYFDRRCLTDKECSQLELQDGTMSSEGPVSYSDKNGPNKCLQTCPADYIVELDKESQFKKCVRCEGPCPKECNGKNIHSIQTVEEFSDCSKIIGDLTIEIIMSNVAQEMEKGLGRIKEITGTLQITHSFPLLNLFFFKSLEIVRGEGKTESLSVYYNKNLQELFPEEQMKTMKVFKKVSFKQNPKLCTFKILELQKYLNLSDSMMTIEANGHDMPCADKNLNMTIKKITHETARLEWEQAHGDQRRVLSYIINYKEIKDKFVDVNIYQGRDACSEDVWMTFEQKAKNDDETGNLEAVITELKPFTTYAVYIQAYTLSSASHSAMTQVETFTTNPWDPSKPRDVEVTANGPSELRVKWTKPKKPNGIIDHYVVFYQKEELNKKEFDKRNYCDHPVVTLKKKKKEELDEKEKYLNSNNSNCCACPKSKSELEAEAKKQQMDIYFEDFIHGSLYCKRYEQLPFKLNENLVDLTLEDLSKLYYQRNNTNQSAIKLRRDQTYTDPLGNLESGQNSGWGQLNATESTSKNKTDGPIEVSVNGTELVLTGLEHFREYSIMVQACHEENPDTKEKLCSALAITQGRTEANSSFDVINTTTIEVRRVANKSSEAIIKWGLPANPNGLTVKFTLSYKLANQDGWYTMCISMEEYYKHKGYRLTGLAPGNWTFRIRPVSLGGDGMFTREKYFFIPLPPGEEKWPIGTIIAIVASFLFVIVAITICYCYFKHRFRKEDMTVISQNANYIPSEPCYTMDDWEVDRSKIRTIREIGQGSFGMVYEGIATGLGDDPNEEIRVAVKTVNDRAGFNDRREFLKEATTMKAFDCYHVVKLLGVVSTGQPALVIMELMALGDLKNYLREHRPDEENPDVTPPCLQDILQMAGEVADGMAYLADKKFVHRDLAARNCMVAEDKTVKIGDFGMTRDVYETDYYRKGGKGMLPVRWMAPESLKDGMFSSMSDVWSYGVVIWEMVTLAAQPYQGLSNDQVIKFITDGSTMDMPENCPVEMAYLMKRCWAKRIKHRPTFKEILAYLLPHLNPRFEKVSYYFSEGGGHASDTGRGLGEEEEEEGVDECSINSLSCEGAAAPRHSLRDGSDYGYGSPTASADSASVYDEGIDPVACKHDNGRGGYYPHTDHLYISNDYGTEDLSSSDQGLFGVEINDMDQPFIRNSFQEVPRVMTRQPNGPESTTHNSGLIELQPLLSSVRTGPHPHSSRPNAVHNSSHSFMPELVDHPHLYSSPAHSLHNHQQFSPQTHTPASSLDTSASQRSSPFSLADTDPLKSGPPGQHFVQPHVQGHQKLEGASNPIRLGLSDPLHAGPPASSHMGEASGLVGHGSVPVPVKSSPLPMAGPLAKPPLRLPTLNQPPGGGFKRVPLFNSQTGREEHRDNGSSSSVPPKESHHQSVSNVSGHRSANLTSSLVTPHEDLHSETSPILSDSLHPSSLGAIASSSEGSKDSGSHSRVNGLSNGYIPMSSASSSNRTTPC
ncbi:hypothetical protein RRG08_033179 [Elysia crispata]|uniref:Tyrosine-protein kinase receptor n=1 Tax=Elysia crispata TaxID=231223 RepID=A0AAE1BAP0_9GAST|nr:hypothetical protein RRG08_033179 [Elysia crispata]